MAIRKHAADDGGAYETVREGVGKQSDIEITKR